jgi:hypothetical protein
MKPSLKVVLTCFSLAAFGGLAQADEHALFTTKSLTPETALKAVNAAMTHCRKNGYQVG